METKGEVGRTKDNKEGKEIRETNKRRRTKDRRRIR
jgi:hypothetical protein